ncbi:MAG: ATP-dependent RecD-like DNA helicase, partial [Oscillospiraceae bacterium]|nr:ATP-dependent RecD-like DNA helicase [Oscillospiraceae bacterium]
IIDETSMVDIMLMAALLKAIKPGARLILIGDADQLPPVGAGNVLNDIIASDRFNIIKLKEIFRQAEKSLIITNAHAINNGKYPNLSVKDNDFFFIQRDDDSEIANTIVDLCQNRLPKKYGKEVKNSIQVITPSRKGSAGTEALNILLQKSLNPPGPKKKEKKSRDIIFREGDKIMQIKNNYDIEWEKDGKSNMGIFNGDIGFIESINTVEESMILNFEDRIAIYDFSMLDELEHAYAITVHKSQGSEYPVVVLPVFWYTPKLLTRNLLYTAVTRAQNMVVIVGQPDVVNRMVDNNRQIKRYTGLEYFLSSFDD